MAGKSAVYRILGEHLVSGSLKCGEEIGLRIDQTLTQDATGTMAYLEFESLGLDRVRNELAVSYVDHNTVQVGFENADDHRYLQTVAASKGIVFSRPGNGICHQVHLERFAVPGKTLLGSDSHTPTCGGIGMVAMGAGGLDVALAMAGEPFRIVCPKVIEIRLSGKLRPFCSAKDVILTVLGRFGVKGNVNTAFEYTGPGVETLSVPERATICNMGAECGVTASVFPSDKVTEKYLASRGRADSFRSVAADPDANYDGLFEIDLSKVEPMVACPHSPGNVKRVSELAGMKIGQVMIGSCTNSSYSDLYGAAAILKGKTIHEDVSLGIAPGSREVLAAITEDGVLADLIKSGARIMECACGFCIGNSCSPGGGGVSLRTNNRNFEGRSGTKDAQIYLVSPETAAASALAGVLTDPVSANIKPVDVPERRWGMPDDGMLIFPDRKSGRAIERGKNIGDPPKCVPLAPDLSGPVALKVGDKITTDHIMPAGPRLKYRSNIPLYSTFVFEGVDRDFSVRASANRDAGKANFIVAGYSYGQGSSREHAAICPAYLGVKAVLALSIERIHRANLCNFGILPLIFSDEKDYAAVAQGDELAVSDAIGQVRKGGDVTVKDVTRGVSFRMKLDANAFERDMLLAGGRLALVGGAVK